VCDDAADASWVFQVGTSPCGELAADRHRRAVVTGPVYLILDALRRGIEGRWPPLCDCRHLALRADNHVAGEEGHATQPWAGQELMSFAADTETNVNPAPLLSDAGVPGPAVRPEPQSPGDQVTGDGWFDPAEEAHVIRRRSVAALRRAYEDRVNTLWRDLQGALAEQIAAYSGRRNDPIQWAQTPAGGFAATRFSRPLALLDVALDSDSGLIACVYTFATHDDAPYQESVRVLLVTERDTMFLRTQEGRRLETCDEAAQDLLTPFIAGLTGGAIST
jgi:hypothetical protein